MNLMKIIAMLLCYPKNNGYSTSLNLYSKRKREILNLNFTFHIKLMKLDYLNYLKHGKIRNFMKIRILRGFRRQDPF